MGKLKDSGTTLVPLQLYFKDGKAKVEIAVAKGKKAHDKREAIKEREADREVSRVVSRSLSGKASRAASKYED
jgi:SsrA-binding protein